MLLKPIGINSNTGCESRLQCTQTHTHLCTHTHTHLHTHTHTHLHTHTYTHTRLHTHHYTCALTTTHPHTHAHTRLQHCFICRHHQLNEPLLLLRSTDRHHSAQNRSHHCVLPHAKEGTFLTNAVSFVTHAH